MLGAGSGNLSTPTSTQPVLSRRKYTSTGIAHDGIDGCQAATWILTNDPGAEGSGAGGCTRRAGVSVGEPIASTWRVALSKRAQLTLYPRSGSLPAPLAAAAFSNVNVPVASRANDVTGFTAFR